MRNYNLPRCAAALVLAGMAALLSACGSNPTFNDTRDPLKAGPQAGESFVVISVTANTAEIKGFDSIRLRRAHQELAAGAKPPAEEYFVLNQIAPGMARDTTLFSGVVPAGEYELDSLYAQVSGKRLHIAGPNSKSGLGAFRVRDGQPVDLGRVLVTPVNAGEIYSGMLYGRSTAIQSNLPLLERFVPDYLRLYTGNVQRGWGAPDAGDIEVERYAFKTPVGAGCANELPDGSVAVASRMNSVLIRNGGRWRLAHGPGIESLLCVLPVDLPNADLIAVGELGTLLRHEKGSAQLIPVEPGNLPSGSYIGIAGNVRAGWYIAVLRGENMVLYHSLQLERGDWTAVRTIPVGKYFLSAWGGFWMWNTPNGFAYAVREGKLHFFDFQSAQWTERNSPDGRAIADVSPNPNGSLGLLTGAGGVMIGVFGRVHLSMDQGANWQTLETPFATKISAPRQLADGTLLTYGGSSPRELYVSKDQGKTWQLLANSWSEHVLQPLKSGVLDVENGKRNIFSLSHSLDDGVSWKSELSNYTTGKSK